MKFGILFTDHFNEIQEELGDMEPFAVYLNKKDEQIDLIDFVKLGLYKSYYIFKVVKAKKK